MELQKNSHMFLTSVLSSCTHAQRMTYEKEHTVYFENPKNVKHAAVVGRVRINIHILKRKPEKMMSVSLFHFAVP